MRKDYPISIFSRLYNKNNQKSIAGSDTANWVPMI